MENKTLTAVEFINIAYPEHSRTSCSDEKIDNGWFIKDDCDTIDTRYLPRCRRCAYLEIVNGTINLIEENKNIISESFF